MNESRTAATNAAIQLAGFQYLAGGGQPFGWPADFDDQRLAIDEGGGAFKIARACHRIVRAMHDGACPKCGYADRSEHFTDNNGNHRCPNCEFAIPNEDVERVMAMFLPFMAESLAIFEQVRAGKFGEKPAAVESEQEFLIIHELGKYWHLYPASDQNARELLRQVIESDSINTAFEDHGAADRGRPLVESGTVEEIKQFLAAELSNGDVLNAFEFAKPKEVFRVESHQANVFE